MLDWFTLAFISALFSATAAISQKKILFKMEALEFSFILALFNLALSIPFFFFVDFASLQFYNIFILYLKTILGAFAFLFVMLSIKNLEISGALPLMVLTPAFVAVFAYFIIDETLVPLEIAGILLLITGTYILETRMRQNIFDPFKVFWKSKAHHYVIGALLLFTLTALLDRVLLYKYKVEPAAFMGFQQFFLAVNFSIFFFFSKTKFSQVLKFSSKNIFGWIILVSVLTIGYRYTQIEAIKIAPVALVLSVKRISVFFAAIIGGKLFSEKNLLKKALATSLMIAGALLLINQ